MKLESLKLTHFRNYADLEINTLGNVNILLGNNAQGKTNFLEAIYLLTVGKSFRTATDRQMIQADFDEALLEGDFSRDNRASIMLGLKIKKHGKAAYLNHLEQKRMSDFIGQINAVIFSPEDLDIVKGTPGYRRHYLDLELANISPKYLHELRVYQRTLKQKNQYLKMMRNGTAKDKTYLTVLNEALATSGGYIAWARRKNIELIESYAQRIHEQLTKDQEELKVSYISKLNPDDLESAESAAAALQKVFAAMMQREIQQGITLSGIQHDDLGFTINGIDVADFGSQGQKRSVSISLKLSEIEIIKQVRHEPPILLLDDIFSELDQSRQTFLIKSFEKELQIFITTTSINDVDRNIIEPPLILNVKDGTITPGGN